MKTDESDILAKKLDLIIERGGTWLHMEKRANRFAQFNNLKKRYSHNIIKAHIKYRQIKDSNYLSHLIVKKEGIFNPEEETCYKCDNKFLRYETFKLSRHLEDFFYANQGMYDERLCEICLEEIKNNHEIEEWNKTADDWRKENSQWPGLDSCDY